VSVHIAIDELADAAAGLLDSERARQVRAHARECAQCRQTSRALAEVTDLLATDPAPPMPPEIARRLDDVLAAESRQRAAGSRHSTAGSHSQTPHRVPGGPYVAPSLGSFGADLPRRRRSRLLLPALAACVAAGVVGFAGYFLSATAGLNEPTAVAPAVVSTQQLKSQADSLLENHDLSPHRFSQAWRCARDVTDGRITALTSAVVDGKPALLVYTRRDGVERVTVVTGCDSGRPSAGPSTTLSR